jgi:hypothetical protein
MVLLDGDFGNKLLADLIALPPIGLRAGERAKVLMREKGEGKSLP